MQDYIGHLPTGDHPEVFGQHPNADIASQIKETRSVVFLSLYPLMLPLSSSVFFLLM